MNILEYEEMIQVQQKLLSLECQLEYQLQGLDQALIEYLSNFSSAIFEPAEAELLQQVHKSIKNAQNVIKLRANQPSATLKIFTYAVVSFILPPSKDSCNKERKGNQLLLETIKCSLFSKDINFTQVSNSNLAVDNHQAKAMIASFFNLLTSSTHFSNHQKIQYADWAFENHPILLQLFVIYFRVILDKLGIEDAANCTKELDYDEAFTNLLEFFDVNCRNQGNLFIFPDQSYFLASVEGSLVFGEYFQNTRNGQKSGDQLLKQSETVKESSFLGKVDRIKQSLRKNGVIEGDMKIFNFMLESGRSSSILQRDRDLQTPHFENINEFAFGRRKKEEDQNAKEEYFKRQFQKILLNSESASAREMDIQAFSQINDTPVAPVQSKRQRKSNERHENVSQNGQEKHHLQRMDTFNERPFLEVDAESYDNQMINPQQSRNNKNIVSVKDKHFTTFSPPAPKAGAFEHFSSFINDNNFLQPDSNNDYLKSSYEKIEDMNLHRFGNCPCAQLRKKRNNLTSKILDFMFIPLRTRNNGCRSPKFLNNLKHSQNITHYPPKIKITPPKPSKNNFDPTSLTIKENRTPNFIKGLKKDKDRADKNSASSRSKQRQSIKDKSLSPSHPKNMTRLDLDKQQSGKFNKFAKFSAILTKNIIQPKPKQSKSTTRKNDSNSLPKNLPTEQAGTIKRFDSQFFNVRPGLGKNNWKSISKVPPPQSENTEKKHPTQIDENAKKDQTGITRIFAPVNIIAPTVYFNGRSQHSNKVIFHLNDGYDQDRSKERRTCRMEAKSEQMRFAQFRKKT